MLAFRRWRRLRWVALQPFLHVVVEELLAPDHSREGLALHHPRVGVGDVVLQLGVELVSLAATPGKDGVEVGEWLAG